MRSATDRARSSGGYYRKTTVTRAPTISRTSLNSARGSSFLVGEALPVRESFAELCGRDLRRV